MFLWGDEVSGAEAIDVVGGAEAATKVFTLTAWVKVSWQGQQLHWFDLIMFISGGGW